MEKVLQDLYLDKSYEVKSYEVTLRNELKPYAILHYLEDVAYLHAEELGFGYSAVAPKGVTWFVLRYNMKFEHFPKAWETITIRTRPCGMKGVQCFREFEIFSSMGERIALIASAWALIDISTKRPLIPSKTVDFPEMSSQRNLLTDFSGFKEFGTPDYQKIFEIRFDDVDINQHVNNANYISWAQETLPYDFRLNYSISEVEITYKREISYGNKVLSLAVADGLTTNHRLLDEKTGDTLCDIKIDWRQGV